MFCSPSALQGREHGRAHEGLRGEQKELLIHCLKNIIVLMVFVFIRWLTVKSDRILGR